MTIWKYSYICAKTSHQILTHLLNSLSCHPFLFFNFFLKYLFFFPLPQNLCLSSSFSFTNSMSICPITAFLFCLISQSIYLIFSNLYLIISLLFHTLEELWPWIFLFFFNEVNLILA